MPEGISTRALIEFDYPAPDADVPWQIEDLGGGVVARYRRTIARRSRVITGTGGYREGVDFHTEIHCSACCCTPSEVDGCRQPAGGFVVIGGRSGCASVAAIGELLKAGTNCGSCRSEISMMLEEQIHARPDQQTPEQQRRTLAQAV
jgi:bacterioferritin-associated ferredoxin